MKVVESKLMESAGTQLHPKAVEFCSADHVPGVM